MHTGQASRRRLDNPAGKQRHASWLLRIAALCCCSATLNARATPAHDALSPAGVQASHIFTLWTLTLTVCSLVFAAVLIALLVAMARAPRVSRDANPDLGPLERPEKRVRRVVGAASIASVVLLFGLLVADIATDRALSRLPVADAVHLEMTGHQWWWEARYADDTRGGGFAVANELHIPVGRPVVISLKADDVIHTFWVPNLHGKKDMIPGRESTIEFRADRAGTYRGQCAEFCGLEHALMAFTVVAEPPAQYDAWLARQRAPAPQPANALQAQGERLFTTGNCAGCHTVRGTSAHGVLGPDLTHVMSRPMLGAGTFENTPANLASWIRAPGSMKPGTTMPASQLSAQDLDALVAWMRTLQ
ncbi:cytochrome c oxidase subunit 2 [Paraburkholderia sp. GV068]|uniref:cytochrome c oxidase subunit II n=1 Tax=unclassified Paraburkholderia TaxID=2615204 RepID=UPI000D304ACA|nr:MULTISPECIES: cytochrome c oxidase subunit II [unclassified Paraburkholderia]PTQ97192.1 cytochrome c oxidase subunit 2 [Paraburkholderia sp. GV072]PUB02730.1 cytochrome c oxidase subunit 2 [Paraburkholderia sp. GV068]